MHAKNMQIKASPITIFRPENQMRPFVNFEREHKTKWLCFHEMIPNGVLYHYTPVEGLRGILTSGKIWFTDAGYLNDGSELHYGYSLISKALIERQRNGTSELLSRSYGNARIYLNMLNTRSLVPYVSCYCENGNLLSQWRNYGSRGGGYAVGFHVPSNLKWCLDRQDPDTKVTQPKLRKVVYDPGEQAKLVQSTFDAYELVYQEEIPSIESVARQYDADPWVAETTATSTPAFHLANILVEYILSFKDPAFGEENEWRLVYVIDNDDKKQQKHIRFRTGNGYIVPYVEVELFQDQYGGLPIKEIVSGPTLDPTMAEHSLRVLLDCQGYTKPPVSILSSGIPMRAGF